MRRVKMRLSGTVEDLQSFLYLFRSASRAGLLRILEESKPYKNRGESELYRVYLEVELRIDPTAQSSPPVSGDDSALPPS